MSEEFESVMTEQEKAAQNYAVGTCLDFENSAAGTVNVLLEIEKAFKAGADWHKSRAFLEIIKDIQKSGGILIVEPLGGTDQVAVDPNSAGGVNFTRIRETDKIPEPRVTADDFSFPGSERRKENRSFLPGRK